MKITTKVCSYEDKVVDVEFPLFFSYWDSCEEHSWEFFWRYDMHAVTTITEHASGRWEFETKALSQGQMQRDLGHHLNGGDHKREHDETFNRQLDKMIIALQAVPR